MIDHYEFGSIIVDGKRYGYDVIIFKGKVKDWWRKTSHNVEVDEAKELAGEGVKKIVFGTGEAGVMKVPEEVRDYLKQRGLEVIILKTSDAVDRFNQIYSDPSALAALHLTC